MIPAQVLRFAHRLAALLALIAFALLIPPCAVSAELPARGDMRFMDVDELRPGMKGYALTVFSGTKPERFPIEIKGVLRNAFADGDMIIFEADHPTLKQHGVVAGMSGSPVFVDDRMIGAIAYGWGFSVRPVGGITPIRSMLGVYEQTTQESRVEDNERATVNAWPEARAALEQSRRIGLESLRLTPEQMRQFGIAPDSAAGAGSGGLFQPLGAPLTISSRNPLVLETLQQAFAGMNVIPTITGLSGIGRGADSQTTGTIENGSAFSVVLADGDIAISALGTATYVEGDRFVGFGHPMFGDGPIDAPVAFSDVITFVPSLMRPFKLGNALNQVGALRQDRQAAVGATLAAESHLVPLHVRIESSEADPHEFNFRVWEDRRFLAALAASCFIESLDRAVRLAGPMEMELQYQIRLRDGRQLDRRQFVSGPDMVGLIGGMMMMDDLLTLGDNPFRPVAFEGISMVARIGSRQKMMALREVTPDRREYKRGQTIRATAKLQPWRGEMVSLPVSMAIPATLRPGTYELRLLDGMGRLALERQMRADLSEPRTFDELFRARIPAFSIDSVYTVLLDTKDKTGYGRAAIPNLPGSIAQTAQATRRGSKAPPTARGTIIDETTTAFDAMIVGSATITITVTED